METRAGTPPAEILSAQSLVFERAYSGMESAIYKISKMLKESEKPSPKLQAALEELKAARKQTRQISDKLWQAAKDCHTPNPANYYALAAAVVMRDVADYENELCKAHPDPATLSTMEKFAEEDSLRFSGLNLKAVYKQLKKRIPVFQKIANENFKEIAAETERLREEPAPDMTKSRFKCPVCGDGLYIYGDYSTGIYEIRCSHCYCWALVDGKERSAANGPNS